MAEDFWEKEARKAEARSANQARTIGDLRKAGNVLASVLSDLLESGLVPCQISRAVMAQSIDKWNEAKTGRRAP